MTNRITEEQVENAMAFWAWAEENYMELVDEYQTATRLKDEELENKREFVDNMLNDTVRAACSWVDFLLFSKSNDSVVVFFKEGVRPYPLFEVDVHECELIEIMEKVSRELQIH